MNIKALEYGRMACDTIEKKNLLINGVCVGTGVLDYQGYIDRPTSVNDLHGMGAFLLMCAEIERIK